MEKFKARENAQSWELRNKYNELVDFVGTLSLEIIKLKSQVEVLSHGSKEESGITKDSESRDTTGTTAEKQETVNRRRKK
jgi:hypothetical protein